VKFRIKNCQLEEDATMKGGSNIAKDNHEGMRISKGLSEKSISKEV